MMKNVIIICILAIPMFVSAQFGASIGYKFNDFKNYRGLEIANGDEIFFYNPGNALEVGIHYWFRLKSKRIEFLPELSYSIGLETPEMYDFNISFQTRVYPMDLANDCDCPTFSKENTFFKKGLFVSAAPILTMLHLPDANTNASYGLRLGAGLDIGVSDLFTITPFLNYGFMSKSKWDSPQIIERASTFMQSKYRTVMLGVGSTFRFDQQSPF